MEVHDEKIFMEQAYNKLLERGWTNGNQLVYSQITDEEIIYKLIIQGERE